jgi:hypothetical protein
VVEKGNVVLMDIVAQGIVVIQQVGVKLLARTVLQVTYATEATSRHIFKRKF